nr:hypothetical protein [Tanacetum cinerariifolium]
MSSSNYPFIIPSDFDIEDAFSSTNSPNYTSASRDYFSASLGNTSLDSLDNSFGLIPIASPTLSLFHDDPYMKVMQAYYAKESPIPPPTLIAMPIILPPSPMLSPSLSYRDLVHPEEILPPKKRAHGQSSFSTSALSQVFKVRESSCVTRLERHKDQIEEI